MCSEYSFISTEHFDRNLYASSQSQERILNAAIMRAEISASFEEYLEIFDAFYADDVEVSSDTGAEAIRGKARVRSLLANFLVPLHIMAEIGGLLISVRHTPIPGDTAGEAHSAWTLEMVGVSGRSTILSWRVLRKWNGSQVAYEHHYDQQQSGGPLTERDLNFNAVTPAAGPRRPS